MSHLAVNNVLYLSGTTPMKDGAPYLTGIVGSDLSLEQGYEAARYALLSSLAVIKYALGDLDRVQQAVQLIGFVNSAPGFSQQPRVINGATDLLVALYGDRGKPTRAAIGCQGLAINHSVEVVLTVLFTGEGTTAPLARDHYVK
jgi:enamine deaminase RidA (YjgF/YER057c/UK114 family)